MSTNDSKAAAKVLADGRLHSTSNSGKHQRTSSSSISPSPSPIRSSSLGALSIIDRESSVELAESKVVIGYMACVFNEATKDLVVFDLILRVPTIQQREFEREMLAEALERLERDFEGGSMGKVWMVMERSLGRWKAQMVKVGFVDERHVSGAVPEASTGGDGITKTENRGTTSSTSTPFVMPTSAAMIQPAEIDQLLESRHEPCIMFAPVDAILEREAVDAEIE
ncbi:hypothetical protein HDV05_007870 [Chytridiales sp. JEL 0842]|nr:hypothetical protein HDV05_007870 [Chytridiales sp. JEL 0842]